MTKRKTMLGNWIDAMCILKIKTMLGNWIDAMCILKIQTMLGNWIDAMCILKIKTRISSPWTETRKQIENCLFLWKKSNHVRLDSSCNPSNIHSMES